MRSAGTAFALSADGILVTARHVFEGEQEGRLVVSDSQGAVYPVSELLASSVGDDLALFRIDATDLVPLPLRTDAQIGTAVLVISHPGSAYYTLTRGSIARFGHNSRLRGVPPARARRMRPAPTLEITAEFGHGSSGAPVMDAAGNVVGVALSTRMVPLSEEQKVPQMWIRTCAPAQRVLRLLKRTPRSS